MKKFKIVYNRRDCIGAAACAAVCPEYWSMNPDGKADLKGSTSNDKGETYTLEITEAEIKDNLKAALACNKDVAEACPANVIRIIDEREKDLV